MSMRQTANGPLTAMQRIELRRLYDILSDAAASASAALGPNSSMPPGLTLDRFRMLDRHVGETYARIRLILGS